MCTREAHEQLKRDPIAWLALEWVGVQSRYDGLGTVLHMRNCACGSTLCKTVRRAWTEDEFKQLAEQGLVGSNERKENP